MSRGRKLLVWLGLVCALLITFVSGFIAHRHGIHRYARPLIAYITGNTGGCALGQAYDALSDAQFQNARRELRSSSKLIERTSDGFSKVQTDRGIFWVPPRTDWAYVIAEQVVRIYGDGPYRVRPGDTVLDCGANIGAFTREALDAGAALVVAIEPVPANVESLNRTFAAEIAAGRVRVVEKGVWNKDDTLTMNLFDNSILDSFVMTERPEGQVSRRVSLPLTTIDGIVADLGLEQVDFIKMDIEGAERQALEGATQTIRRYRPRMSIATENLPDDYEVLPRTILGIESAYRWVCGPCSFIDAFAIRPETIYFMAR